jgi:transcriptional regulator with XRE-family HTH domain
LLPSSKNDRARRDRNAALPDDYERGEANPTLASLVAIANAYDVTLSEMLKGRVWKRSS